jgi:glyoxylase-like metal-dependent hydrolase (beta-lactamase superfamily II)
MKHNIYTVLMLSVLTFFTCVVQAKGKLSVTRFHFEGVGSVNTWILEDDNGLVLVDVQRTHADGAQLAKTLKEKNKKLYAILVTHPHPDHIGGIPSVLASFPNTPIYALPEVNQELKTDKLGIMAFARRVNGDKFPKETPTATHMLKAGQSLNFGDIDIVVNDIGPGEAVAMTAFYVPSINALFAGDLIENNMQGFVYEQRTSRWLGQLDEVRLDYPTNPMTYPGHGAEAPLFGLLDAQGKLLRDMRDIVNLLITDGEFSEQDAIEAMAEFEKRHPNQTPVAPIDGLGILNLRAVAKELLGQGL